MFTRFKLVLLLSACGFLLCAFPVIAKELEVVPTQAAKSFFEQGKTKFDKRAYSDAAWLFRRACESAKKQIYPDAWFYLGQSLIASKDYAEAVNCFKRAEDQDPKIQSHLYLAACYVNTGEIDGAKEELVKTPSDYFPRARKYVEGRIAEEAGDYKQALECFSCATPPKEKIYIEALLAKIRIEKKLDRYNDASEDYLRILGSTAKSVDWEEMYEEARNCFLSAGRSTGILELMRKFHEKRTGQESPRKPETGDFQREDGTSIWDLGGS